VWHTSTQSSLLSALHSNMAFPPESWSLLGSSCRISRKGGMASLLYQLRNVGHGPHPKRFVIPKYRFDGKTSQPMSFFRARIIEARESGKVVDLSGKT